MKQVVITVIIILIGAISLFANQTNALVEKKVDNESEKNNNIYHVNYENIASAIFNKIIWDNSDNKEDEEDTEETGLTPISEVPVLNYHFFYENKDDCLEDICLDINKFKEHIQYLKDNNYKILTLDEYQKWLYGKEELYEKSVLITVDDGAFGTSKINGNYLIPVLEEYQVNATLFLITGWWDKKDYESKYLSIESHGYDIHQKGECGLNRIECLSYKELKNDLKKSLSLVDDNLAFAYPFYDYTDEAVKALKKLNFKLAFIGGNKKSTREDNKYLIPRYPIDDNTSMEEFINMIN